MSIVIDSDDDESCDTLNEPVSDFESCSISERLSDNGSRCQFSVVKCEY